MTRRLLRSSLLLSAACAFLVSSNVRAAGTTVSATDSIDPYAATADLTVRIQLSSAIVLVLQGKTSAPSSMITLGTDTVNANAAGVLDFGSMNTACSPASSNGGVCIRFSNPNPPNNSGARFIATIDATVTVSGASNSKLGFTIPIAGVPAPMNNAYFRTCGNPGQVCDSAGTSTYWGSYTCGGGGCTPVPTALAAGDQLSGSILSGSFVEHQIALEFDDGDQSLLPTDLVVTYVAQPN